MATMPSSMTSLSRFARPTWLVAGSAACLIGAWVALTTIQTVVSNFSAIPWYDDWKDLTLYRAWSMGNMPFLDALLQLTNEHRVAFPRLVLFADDRFYGGLGTVPIIGIFVVQACHAGLFAIVLHRARPAHPGRWMIGGVVVALMMSLRQAENFTSGLQIAFAAVFAAATGSALAFGRAVERLAVGRTPWPWFAGSLAAAFVACFSMANGLLVAPILAVMAILARAPRLAAGYLAFAAVVTPAYFFEDAIEAPGSPLTENLHHPGRLAFYVAAYLGGIASDPPSRALAMGALGILSTVLATARAATRMGRPGASGLVAVMLFCGATAALTAAGRLQFGPEQALSSRYCTGSAAFWAATLVYWWTNPLPWPRLHGAARFAIIMVAVVLFFPLIHNQRIMKSVVTEQAARRDRATDLLALGLKDKAVTEAISWPGTASDELLDWMQASNKAIFALPDVRAIGRPITDIGTVADAPGCQGDVAEARSAPNLGVGAVRVSGTAMDGGRPVTRVFLVDDAGEVRGIASGHLADRAPMAWEGYAVAPPGSHLRAYLLRTRGRLCPTGPPVGIAAPGADASADGLSARTPDATTP